MSVAAPSAAGGLWTRARGWWAQSQSTRTPNSVLLVLAIIVLNVVGLVMVLSASSVLSIDTKGDPWWFFERQLLWIALGAIGFVVVSRTDYHRWRRVTMPLLVFAFALLTIVLIPGLGIKVDGARRWLGVGSFTVQPSEIAKLALLLFCADVLTRREREVGEWRQALRPIVVVLGFAATLMMLEPDLASLMVMAVTVSATLVVGGVRGRHLSALGVTAVGFVTAFAIAVPWRRARMLAFLDPNAHISGAGYQVHQSLIAISTGGWTGVGLGAGRSKWRFLPAAHTDFIFAVIGEELGLIGCLLVLGLFATVAVVGVRTAVRAPDRYGMIVAAGATAWIIGQAVLNLGAVLSVLPVTGVPLPFISSGGTALVSTMITAGLLVNVARQGRS